MTPLKRFAIAALLATATLASTVVLAQTAPDMATGEVKKIDKEAQKITLKHGEIKNMEMPPMTMVFKALNPTLLDQVKVGDKVNFSAEKRDGAIVITTIEVAK